MLRYLFLAVLVSCYSSNDKDYQHLKNVNNVTTSEESGADEPSSSNEMCVDGEKKPCHVIKENQNVVSCFVGIQICLDGGWTSCEESKK